MEGDHLKLCKQNNAGEIFDQQGQLVLPGNPKAATLMFICEVPQNANEYLQAESSRSKISIGEILMLDSNMLKVDGKVPPHNFWFFKFATMFEPDLKSVRFIEMRPKKN